MSVYELICEELGLTREFFGRADAVINRLRSVSADNPSEVATVISAIAKTSFGDEQLSSLATKLEKKGFYFNFNQVIPVIMTIQILDWMETEWPSPEEAWLPEKARAIRNNLYESRWEAFGISAEAFHILHEMVPINMAEFQAEMRKHEFPSKTVEAGKGDSDEGENADCSGDAYLPPFDFVAFKRRMDSHVFQSTTQRELQGGSMEVHTVVFASGTKQVGKNKGNDPDEEKED